MTLLTSIIVGEYCRVFYNYPGLKNEQCHTTDRQTDRHLGYRRSLPELKDQQAQDCKHGHHLQNDSYGLHGLDGPYGLPDQEGRHHSGYAQQDQHDTNDQHFYQRIKAQHVPHGRNFAKFNSNFNFN